MPVINPKPTKKGKTSSEAKGKEEFPGQHKLQAAQAAALKRISGQISNLENKRIRLNLQSLGPDVKKNIEYLSRLEKKIKDLPAAFSTTKFALKQYAKEFTGLLTKPTKETGKFKFFSVPKDLARTYGRVIQFGRDVSSELQKQKSLYADQIKQQEVAAQNAEKEKQQETREQKKYFNALELSWREQNRQSRVTRDDLKEQSKIRFAGFKQRLKDSHTVSKEETQNQQRYNDSIKASLTEEQRRSKQVLSDLNEQAKTEKYLLRQKIHGIGTLRKENIRDANRAKAESIAVRQAQLSIESRLITLQSHAAELAGKPLEKATLAQLSTLTTGYEKLGLDLQKKRLKYPGLSFTAEQKRVDRDIIVPAVNDARDELLRRQAAAPALAAAKDQAKIESIEDRIRKKNLRLSSQRERQLSVLDRREARINQRAEERHKYTESVLAEQGRRMRPTTTYHTGVAGTAIGGAAIGLLTAGPAGAIVGGAIGALAGKDVMGRMAHRFGPISAYRKAVRRYKRIHGFHGPITDRQRRELAEVAEQRQLAYQDQVQKYNENIAEAKQQYEATGGWDTHGYFGVYAKAKGIDLTPPPPPPPTTAPGGGGGYSRGGSGFGAGVFGATAAIATTAALAAIAADVAYELYKHVSNLPARQLAQMEPVALAARTIGTTFEAVGGAYGAGGDWKRVNKELARLGILNPAMAAGVVTAYGRQPGSRRALYESASMAQLPFLGFQSAEQWAALRGTYARIGIGTEGRGKDSLFLKAMQSAVQKGTESGLSGSEVVDALNKSASVLEQTGMTMSATQLAKYVSPGTGLPTLRSGQAQATFLAGAAAAQQNIFQTPDLYALETGMFYQKTKTKFGTPITGPGFEKFLESMGGDKNTLTKAQQQFITSLKSPKPAFILSLLPSIGADANVTKNIGERTIHERLKNNKLIEVLEAERLLGGPVALSKYLEDIYPGAFPPAKLKGGIGAPYTTPEELAKTRYEEMTTEATALASVNLQLKAFGGSLSALNDAIMRIIKPLAGGTVGSSAADYWSKHIGGSSWLPGPWGVKPTTSAPPMKPTVPAVGGFDSTTSSKLA